ncbi:nucleoside-diphosphate sugar epimerase [Nocardiopsis terrae]|uniref:Uncharacterized protein YbjT (DUF2867 family) n=1 Tax=Nocardiopsis terrae TaxID=372655 RepID=A0ABR9HJP6_9ACTN|nr:SDR family oxidoreductase [Nocardiopsis terrae]MBE1459223.1 uncharacterized protein YbjT (DUF2867 family) [Nocardiopsis terrae]GHC88830.1 nucleoside-diphosphate sugar epimerase [Nocardiopsis terrae]
MRVAVVGATGRIGALTLAALRGGGHDAVAISRGHGVDVLTGQGLDEALTGVDAVIDVLNCTSGEEAGNVRFFTTATERLMAAGQRAGVGHHVVLSIAAVDRVKGNPHYAGKRAQEAAVEAGPVPHTIVPATQFHDFAAMVASWTETDGVARIAPLLVRPIAPEDVADILVRVAAGEPLGRHRDVTGPGPQDLVDMARRTHAVRGHRVELVPTWENGIFDAAMAGNVLLPAADAEVAPTSFEDWLAAQAE